QAALLLTQGYGPGETARMLGYGSLAWFSRRFHALTGQTPGAYRRAPHPLHLCER
ncbi:protein containing Helix-turn-helix, AraC type domain protein, partial [human gut metagenome]